MNIDDLTIEQLLDLNANVCRRIDELRAKQDREALALLRPGMQVKFINDDEQIIGVLLKRNKKTVVIASENGKQHYKVPAGLVSPVKI